jgi:hypothetical protein
LDLDFATFIANERQRLQGERQQILNQQQEVGKRLDAINRELAAIDAYANATAGKPIIGSDRGRRVPRRDALLALIRDDPEGLSRGDILDRLGIKGDKKQENNISNALTGLIKSGHLDRQNGTYRLLGAP